MINDQLIYRLNRGVHKHTQTKAFTLIEILVALVILAIALTAIIKAINDNLAFANDVQNRTVASWVGDEILARMQANLIAPPSNSASSGYEQMLGNNWYWQATGERKENSAIIRITIDVSQQKGGQSIAKIIGFVRVTS